MLSRHICLLFMALPLVRAAIPTKLKWELIGGACAIGTICAANCIKIISTGDACLVERLGVYHRSLGPGISLVFHPFEKISFTGTYREQVMDVPPQECFTKDNAPITSDAIVYMRIVDMKDACYNVFDVKNAVRNLCLTNIREEVGRLTLEEAFSSRGELNSRLLSTLNEVCKSWGIEITRVEIQSLQPSADVLRALESQIAAERKKHAYILQSEGERMKLVNEAEGKAQAMLADAEARKKSIILASQAEAERQKLEADGIRAAVHTVVGALVRNGNDPSTAVRECLQFLGLVRYMETQGKLAASSGTKFLMFPTQDSLPLTNLMRK